MKKALVIPALLLLFLAFQNNIQAQDAKVKSIEFKNFEREEEKEAKDLLLIKKEYREFDAKGRMVNYQVHKANPIGELVKRSEIQKQWNSDFRSEAVSKFDEMGDIITTEKSYYSIKDNTKTKVEYTDYLKAPNDPYSKVFTYMASGQPNKITIQDKKGKKIGEEVYKYNREEEEIQLKIWRKNLDGSKYSYLKKTKYNDDGTLNEREIQIKNGSESSKEVITFGKRNKVKQHLKYKNGELVSQFGGAKPASYNPNKTRVLIDFGSDKKSGGSYGGFGLWATEDEFDDNGNKTKTIQTTDGEVTQETSYKYDERDNLIETIKISFNEGKETNKEREVFEYNKYNKMLKKSIFSNGLLVSEKTYDYTYH